jgi:hypothetical protein
MELATGDTKSSGFVNNIVTITYLNGQQYRDDYIPKRCRKHQDQVYQIALASKHAFRVGDVGTLVYFFQKVTLPLSFSLVSRPRR